MREFPHLADTRFPNFDNVNVYSFKNTFDYTRWVPNTRIHLCNVLWDSDYDNVVKFENNAARDSYFSGLSDEHVITLESDCRIVPDGFVKLDIPYDVMARYNYLWLELPIATSEDEMIQYETGNGIRKWFFFIDGCRYLAPNTTQVYVSFDIWTNHINDMRFTYGMLERGHAPVNMVDTDAYLKDPINNTRYLLADDVNFGDNTIVKNSTFIPFGNGKKYIVMFTTVNPTNLSSLGTVVPSSQYTYKRPLTYSNVPGRQGYQLQVDNYGTGNGYDYSNQKTVVNQGGNAGEILPNNLFVLAIAARDANKFFSRCVSDCPAFLNTIRCICMIDENMLQLTRSYNFMGTIVYHVVATRRDTVSGIKLNRGMFDIPSELQRFTKLYTFPYSVLELTDNNGKSVEIRVENVSKDSTMISDVSLAFPYLNLRVLFSGINGVGSDRYQWKNLLDDTIIRDIPNGDWREVCFDFDIPTYAMYVDGATMFNLRSFNRSIKNANDQALIAYHTGVRDANTARENALDANATAKTNADNTALTAKANADLQATTARTNSKNMASTEKTNQDNNATTLVDNTANDITTSLANVALTIAGNVNNKDLTINANNAIKDYGEAKNSQLNILANNMIQYTTQAQNEAAIATTQNNGDYEVTSGIMDGVIKGATIGAAGGPALMVTGAAVFGIAGAICPSISAEGANVNAQIMTQTSQSVADATVANNNGAVLWTNTYADLIQVAKNSLMTDQLTNSNNVLNDQTTNSTNTARTNANNTANTMRANSWNTKDTLHTNADNTYTTSTTVASNNKDTANVNAANTKTRGDENATYTRENAILNLKEILEGSQNTAQNALLDSYNTEPIQVGDYGGDCAPDYYGTKGLQVKVRTQNESAIKQAGSQFARFGYMLNQEWDVDSSGFNVMKNFTYWKFSDIWVDDLFATNNNAQKIVASILKKGVTVWSDPDKIGKVGIYDN